MSRSGSQASSFKRRRPPSSSHRSSAAPSFGTPFSFLYHRGALLLILFALGNLGSSPRTSPTLCRAWEWSDYLVGVPGGGDNSSHSPTMYFAMDEIGAMRVRDLKWHLTRRHGYGADEVGRILDKKELIEALAFEEEKARLKEQAQVRRIAMQRGIGTAVLAVLVVLCWPLIRHGYEILEINVVVYMDRKRHEAFVCRELQSVEASLWFGLMLVLDLLQLWLSISVALSWFVRRRSKFLFPTPSLPLRPAQLLGGPLAQSAAGQYGINVGPMVVTWVMRWIHSRLEAWTGRALVRARQAQRRRARETETAEERAARKEAKKRSKEAMAEGFAASSLDGPVRPSTSKQSAPTSWMQPHDDEVVDRGSTSATHQAFLQQIEEYASPLDDLD